MVLRERLGQHPRRREVVLRNDRADVHRLAGCYPRSHAARLLGSAALDATVTRTSAQRVQQLADAPFSVRVEELSKAFRLPHERYSTLKERALHPFTTLSYDAFHALEDVSFEVKKGEF